MEDDSSQVTLNPLRELTKALVDLCEDVGLLDLIAKMLLSA